MRGAAVGGPAPRGVSGAPGRFPVRRLARACAPAACAAALSLAAWCPAAPARADGAEGMDAALSLAGTGLREYYCTATLALENRGAAPVVEVNGHLISHVGEEVVGRSKGASFLAVAPGARAEAVLETPNAPCDAVTSYVFVVGACRGEAGFLDRAACAAAIEPRDPVAEVVPR